MNYPSGNRRQVSGLAIAGATALISGVSVFVNSYGVHDFSSSTLYTTAKNIVATVVLIVGALIFNAMRSGQARAAQRTSSSATPVRALSWRAVGYAYVGIIGGGVAFVLFFDGLARTAAAPAAFLHDTLVIFVALIAWPVLSERISAFNLAAIGLLVVGAVAISGGVGHLGLGSGPLLVLGATVLWAAETVIVKRLLSSTTPGRIAIIRMGVGAIVLIGDLLITGRLSGLATLGRAQLGWALITGVLLAAYVATWFVALSRARAIDVTSVLVASVAVTSLLQAMSGKTLHEPTYLGVVLVALGIAALVAFGRRRELA
jgi:drug/metabolite transporter (DMT)-like permease